MLDGAIVAQRLGKNARGKTAFMCLCDCGNEYVAEAGRINAGRAQHCGCLKPIKQSAKVRRHGMSRTPEHRSWEGMLQRCNNHCDKNYKRYGGRGIKVCERWLVFDNFFADMGPRPSPGFTLDRIDVHGDYEPGNCRWATAKTQACNRTNNANIVQNGRQITVFEFCGNERTPMYQRILYRIKRGWSIADAIFQPARP